MGLRFRLHRKDLPGKLDIVLPKYSKVIFVHGCFWHGHKECNRLRRPTPIKDFWNKKLDSNQKRDKTNQAKHKQLGWEPVIIWECETWNINRLKNKIINIFNLESLENDNS